MMRSSRTLVFPLRLLTLNESSDNIHRIEVFNVEVFIFNADAEFLLHPPDKLHCEKRIDKTESKYVVAIAEVVCTKGPRKEHPDLAFDIIHNAESFLLIISSVGVKSLPGLSAMQSCNNHL